jgi:hypothetical protein
MLSAKNKTLGEIQVWVWNCIRARVRVLKRDFGDKNKVLSLPIRRLGLTCRVPD